MFQMNEIRPTKKSIEFIIELKQLLHKHKVTMYNDGCHIVFTSENKRDFAQCHCVNGISTIK